VSRLVKEKTHFENVPFKRQSLKSGFDVWRGCVGVYVREQVLVGNNTIVPRSHGR
jgi:hypothetical protein